MKYCPLLILRYLERISGVADSVNYIGTGVSRPRRRVYLWHVQYVTKIDESINNALFIF